MYPSAEHPTADGHDEVIPPSLSDFPQPIENVPGHPLKLCASYGYFSLPPWTQTWLKETANFGQALPRQTVTTATIIATHHGSNPETAITFSYQILYYNPENDLVFATPMRTQRQAPPNS